MSLGRSTQAVARQRLAANALSLDVTPTAQPKCPRYATLRQLCAFAPTYALIQKHPALERHFAATRHPGYLMLKRTTRLVLLVATLAYVILKSIMIAPIF